MERVSFRAPDREPRYAGDRCYNSLLLSAVSTDGGVYPCQSVASPANDALRYGDVKTRSFGEIWTDYVRTWHDRQSPTERGCPSCTAQCEAQLNEALRKDSNARVRL
jgi:radical SAM protein with 4Fe4S-binding SPASM domain